MFGVANAEGRTVERGLSSESAITSEKVGRWPRWTILRGRRFFFPFRVDCARLLLRLREKGVVVVFLSLVEALRLRQLPRGAEMFLTNKTTADEVATEAGTCLAFFAGLSPVHTSDDKRCSFFTALLHTWTKQTTRPNTTHQADDTRPTQTTTTTKTTM